MSILELIGLIFVMVILPVPIGWIVIHNTINFWRKLGKKSYFIILTAWILAMFIIYLLRDYITTYKLDYHYTIQIIGMIIILVASYIDIQRARVFDIKHLIGLPELTLPKLQVKEKLIARGIYSKIRHPRYLTYILFTLGTALLTKLLFLFVFFPVIVLLIHLLIISEERELKNRFKNYEKYTEKVPKFIPKI